VANNILESYFVRVVAMPDGNSFLRLSRTLLQVQNEITGLVGAGVSSMLKFEAASVSTFAAIGLGMIALADKAAMTDQSYRLLGLRMLMTKDSFQAFQQALDDVGVTADQAAYDPESNRRVQEQYARNQRLQKQLGPDFEKNMERIRDIRIEVKELGRDAEYLEYEVVNKMFMKLGFGSDTISEKLDRLNNWFEANLPGIADKVSDLLIPVWQDAGIVLGDFGEILEQVGGDFSYLMGVLNGDDSIKNTQFSVENLTSAFKDMFELITKMTLGIGIELKTLLYLTTSVGESAASLLERLHGNKKKSDELSANAYKEWGLADDNVRAMLDPSRRNDTADFSRYQSFVNSKNKLPDGALSSLIKKYTTGTDVDPELAAAIIYRESGNNPGAVSSTGAEGLMQLMPGTAKQYGVTDSFDPDQNIRGGVRFLADLLKKYGGDKDKVIAAYNAGPGAVDKYGGIPPYRETQNYVQKVNKEYEVLKRKSQESGGEVVIHQMNITVPPNTPQEKIHEIINDSMNDHIKKNTVNTMSQTAGGAYY
jgi:hypothetical protein